MPSAIHDEPERNLNTNPDARRSGESPSGWWEIAGVRADTRAVLENGAGAIRSDWNIQGRNPLQGPGSGARWDTYNNRTGSRYGVTREPETKMGPSEYFIVVGMVTIGIVIAAVIVVGFYNTVLVPTMAAQVQNALQTGMTADQQRP